MKDPILYKKLLKEMEEGNVNVSRAGDLAIFKYTQDCHIKGRWNDVNRLARGLIMKADGTVVARPFPKFFNLGEVSESSIDNLPWNEEVEIYEKVDGSCGIGYYIDGQWNLATPGSLISDQAVFGTHLLNSHDEIACYADSLQYLPTNCTPVFEIIYPNNRIVVDYHGETFLSLLAIFELNGEEWHPRRVDQIAEKAGFHRPRRYNIDLRGDIPFEENHEGYVARFASGLRIKVKSPAYLRVHRLLNYMSPKGVIDLIRGKEYGITLLQLPQGIQKDFDDIRAYVQNLHDQIANEARDVYDRVPKGVTRKEQALFIQAHAKNERCGLVFGLLDNKDIKDSVWKLVQEKVKDEKTKTIAAE